MSNEKRVDEIFGHNLISEIKKVVAELETKKQFVEHEFVSKVGSVLEGHPDFIEASRYFKDTVALTYGVCDLAHFTFLDYFAEKVMMGIALTPQQQCVLCGALTFFQYGRVGETLEELIVKHIHLRNHPKFDFILDDHIKAVNNFILEVKLPSDPSSGLVA